MFSLFTALFGGLYYGGKYAIEKAKTAEVVERNKKERISEDNFRALCAAPFHLEQEIKEYISCGQHYREICNLLREDLVYSIGADWEEQIEIPNGSYEACNFSSHSSTTYWIFHLLLAYKGKMSRWEMSMGYMVNHIAIHDGDLGKNKIIRPRNIRFLQRIEKRLKENNIPVRLVEDSFNCKVIPDIFCLHASRRLW